MKPKIVGTGKCGCKFAYDFFAYIHDMKDASFVRSEKSSWGRWAESLRLGGMLDRAFDLTLTWQTWQLEHLHGTLLAEPTTYALIDSDPSNEIGKFLQLVEENAGARRRAVFPAAPLKIGSHVGGCDWNFVGEALGRSWSPISPTALADDGADIVVVVFAGGGGTGGGLATVLADSSKRVSPRHKTSPPQTFYMGIIAFPQTRQSYVDDGRTLPAVDGEVENAGRFMVSFYGGAFRTGHPGAKAADSGMSGQADPGVNSVVNRALDGLWILGNDLLRYEQKSDPKEQAQLSMLNQFISSALAELCNASSAKVAGDSDFDVQEMHGRIDGRVFVSGVARRQPERGDEGVDFEVRSLLLGALGPGRRKDGEKRITEGLSIPLKASEWETVKTILEATGMSRSARVDALIANRATIPVEFYSTETVVWLFGQSEIASPFKQQILSEYLEVLFPSARLAKFAYTHVGPVDSLVLFLVDPLIPLVLSAIGDYIQRVWIPPSREAPSANDLLSGVLAGRTAADALKALRKEEPVKEPGIFGTAAAEFAERSGKIRRVTQDELGRTMATLAHIAGRRPLVRKPLVLPARG